MTVTGILPTYQRFVNGVPVPFSRRYFRPREKYVILLAVLTFCLVFFCTFFFLPEFRGTNNYSESSGGYKVYEQLKKAGSDFLLPPPPPLGDLKESKIVRHDDDTLEDPHVVDDREKLRAKIEQDGDLKVLERPDLGLKRSTSSTSRPKISQEDDEIFKIPPAPSDHYPLTTNGEDKDPTMRERRNKVKEVGNPNFSKILNLTCLAV